MWNMSSFMSSSYFDIRLIIFFNCFCGIQSFWPPPYTIDLHDNDTFEISEEWGIQNDKIVADEDEMIPESDLTRYKFNINPHNFARLHQAIRGIEKRSANKETQTGRSQIVFEDNFYQEYPEERNVSKIIYSFKDNQNVEYHNSMSKHSVQMNIEEQQNPMKIKRNGATTTDKVVDYDYESMKRKFEENLAQELSTEEKYTEMKDYEGVADSLKTIWKKKEEINCTIAEMKNINGKALLCLLKEPNSNKASIFFTRVGKIALIWLIVYIIIAVPLWCTRGWCCCCFRCKFCHPRSRIDWIKDYYTQNPVGVLHDDHDNRVEYRPTEYEKYYYNNLEKELKKLISH